MAISEREADWVTDQFLKGLGRNARAQGASDSGGQPGAAGSAQGQQPQQPAHSDTGNGGRGGAGGSGGSGGGSSGNGGVSLRRVDPLVVGALILVFFGVWGSIKMNTTPMDEGRVRVRLAKEQTRISDNAVLLSEQETKRAGILAQSYPQAQAGASAHSPPPRQRNEIQMKVANGDSVTLVEEAMISFPGPMEATVVFSKRVRGYKGKFMLISPTGEKAWTPEYAPDSPIELYQFFARLEQQAESLKREGKTLELKIIVKDGVTFFQT